jgi:hypothetical protein
MAELWGSLLEKLKTINWEEDYEKTKETKNYRVIQSCLRMLSEINTPATIDLYSSILVAEAKVSRNDLLTIVEEITKITEDIPAFLNRDLSMLKLEEQEQVVKEIDSKYIKRLKELGTPLRKELTKALPYLEENKLELIVKLCRSIHAISYTREELDKMVTTVVEKVGTDINAPLNNLVMILLEKPRMKFHTISMIEKQINDFYSNCILFTDKSSMLNIAELLFTVHCLSTISSCDVGITV